MCFSHGVAGHQLPNDMVREFVSKGSLDSGCHHLSHDGFRCVKRSGFVTLFNIHEALEHTAQHVRRNRVDFVSLPYGETEPLK